MEAAQIEVQANLTVAFLEEGGESLADYDSMCGELADQVLQWLDMDDRTAILYVAPIHLWDDIHHGLDSQEGWSYHMVVVVDGLVHDAWYPTLILPPDEYIQAAFPGQKLRWEVRS